MSLQVLFLQEVKSVIVVGFLFLFGNKGNNDVRCDSLGLNGSAVGGVVPGCGKPYGSPVLKGNYCLHRALAECLHPKDNGPLVILERSGDDFRRAGAALIDQYNNWIVGFRA